MFAFFQNSTRCVGFRSRGARAFFFFSRFFGELRISPPLLNFRHARGWLRDACETRTMRGISET